MTEGGGMRVPDLPRDLDDLQVGFTEQSQRLEEARPLQHPGPRRAGLAEASLEGASAHIDGLGKKCNAESGFREIRRKGYQQLGASALAKNEPVMLG